VFRVCGLVFLVGDCAPALAVGLGFSRARYSRKGFAGYWRWKSRSPRGRPRIAREVRELIRRMSFENSLWGATKIHGELLKLGIAVAQSGHWRLGTHLPDRLAFWRKHRSQLIFG
jgi:hypothetical protein